MPGEAVTLQLGHYAGCVGAHWWGLQAAALRGPTELRPSTLLRAGREPGGRETHTPRLVALELKGGVGALRLSGADAEAPVSWDGEVASYLDCDSAGSSAPRDAGSRTGDASGGGKRSSSAAATGTSAASAQLGGSQELPSGSRVQLWSDYLNVPLHPKSLCVLRQYLHEGDCGCLEAFGQGESLLQDPGCAEELEDRLHFYAEECDQLQGFQVLCDLHNGFSGVGAKVTELLHDEYSGKGILTWGLTPVMSDEGDLQKNCYRLMNTALGIVHLSTHSSLFCPLSLRGSLGLRPRPPVSFPYINCEHSPRAPAALQHSASIPPVLLSSSDQRRLPAGQSSQLPLSSPLQILEGHQKVSWEPSPLQPAQPQLSAWPHSRAAPALCSSSWPLGSTVESVPVLAALQASPVLQALLRSLHRDLQQLDLRRCPSFFSAGVEQEDFQVALEELRTLSQCYEAGLGAEESEDEADSD
ncbi:protein misato homolog 1 isoform X6 [Melanerpes formicivorus]|uniref:protein misato homolog 1 isoform X6 n=1 Tax=Melanerpes formicivorus TaxID=211600 RepID=UPI00358E6E21